MSWHLTVKQEGVKYQVNTSTWEDLEYDQNFHDQIKSLINEKIESMGESISVSNLIQKHQLRYLNLIENNNKIISSIINEIDSITTKRKKVNKCIAEYLMKRIWIDSAETRRHYFKIKNEISKIQEKIIRLKEKEKKQNIVQIMFNQLLEFIGMNEYYLDDENKLTLRLDKDYDISNEGFRISTAQRKILSLCYFFAEIISEIDDINKLTNYIVIFDDPLDSADYIYFHSIATVIEKSEQILGKILKKPNLKFGQSFVFTHNSLLFDRLNCRWAKNTKTIIKKDNMSQLVRAEKSINNYRTYIELISKYYRNPNSEKKQMIFIGNVIRRVLEIIASFNNLGSNNFQEILNGLGKPKLALLANHLSHESFAKVLNPFSTSEELVEACGELFEVIEECHPEQYKKINETFLN